MASVYAFFLCSACLISCMSDTDKATKGKGDSLPSKTSGFPRTPDKSDTLIISSKAAVVHGPDSLKIEQLKASSGEEDFYAGAGDYIFYLNESAEYLEKKRVGVIHAEDKK
jgi:hypothetical protein